MCYFFFGFRLAFKTVGRSSPQRGQLTGGRGGARVGGVIFSHRGIVDKINHETTVTLVCHTRKQTSSLSDGGLFSGGCTQSADKAPRVKRKKKSNTNQANKQK
jgi:hypothetical protein